MALLGKVQPDERGILNLLTYSGEPLPQPNSPEFGAAFERFADAKSKRTGRMPRGSTVLCVAA